MATWRSRLQAIATLGLLAATGCASQPAPSLVLPLPSPDETAAMSKDVAETATPRPTSRATAAAPVALDRQLADSEELREERNALVDGAIASAVDDARIVEAFRTVPRHAFVPTGVLERAYADFALPIEAGQTISQPSLVAMMTALVEIEPGERVLEVGTGSGFQAAILRQLTDEVYSVEIIPELSEIARTVLDRLGYGDVNVDRRDGYLGWPEAAPFDAIVVTAAPDHLPRPLVEQLSPDDGRMVIPIGPVGDVQTLWLVTRNGEDVAMEEVVPVRFVPLTREEP